MTESTAWRSKRMYRLGIALVMFLLAVGVSVGISYFLFGQPNNINSEHPAETRIEELDSRLSAVEASLQAGSGNYKDSPLTDEDLDVLLSRLNTLDRRVKELSSAEAGELDESTLEVREVLARAAEEKAREVYKDMKDEERRKQEEQWQRRREERWQETQDWLENVYNERLVLLTKELSLTSNQEVQVREAIDARKATVLEIYANWQLPENERRDNLPSWDEINKNFDNAMKQTLDQQQYRTYKQKRLDDFNRGRGRGRGR
jgi:hypothetical protein